MTDQEKAQKLAAAKRRVEQIKKKKSNVKKDINSSEATLSPSSSREIPNSFDQSHTNEATTEDSKTKDSVSSGEIEQEAAIYHITEPNFPSSPKTLVPELSNSINHDNSTSFSSTQEIEGLEKEDGSNRTQHLNMEGITSTQSVVESSGLFEIEGSSISKIRTEYHSQLEALKNENSKLEKECVTLRTSLVKVEVENHDLHRELKMLQSRQTLNMEHEGFEQTENESHTKLSKKIKELEEEIFELRRGIQLSSKNIQSHENSPVVTSSGAKFIDVDLGAYSSRRRDSSFSAKGGLGKLISNGLNAITGTSNGLGEDRTLEEDELLDFDEDAFRLAKEEESKQRIERIKNIKRALKEWEGWRLNLVDSRCNFGDGASPVFEI
ncbi:putative m protein repeat protein [Erysiphe neolycopersici]|uniref:Putative m protein repeat protein n=1 Tax=Erysiphe neolycopersici TaxID=212602 RepID=A0A420H871_9PEZI|nr:putative m protein repeat protein [Erysiphe neolycopersici]